MFKGYEISMHFFLLNFINHAFSGKIWMELMAQTHVNYTMLPPEALAIDPVSLVTKDLSGSAHGRSD